MSDQDGENSPMRTEASHRNATHNESMEDALASNNSIIGKVKSRVSSIFPNSLSKWFSPSTKNNNDSLNGSINNNSNISRRRRRIEVEEEDDVEEEEDEEEDVEDDDEEHETGEFDENLFTLEPDRNDDDNSDESNNSDEAVTNVKSENLKNSRRGILRTTAVRQPPTKRSRLNLDHTFITNSNRNTPLIQRQPLLSSTPDIGGGNLSTQFSSGSRSTNRYTHLNLYGNQGRKEAAYNFNSSPVVNAMTTSKVSPHYDPDIIDLVPEEAVDSNIRSGGADLISSRRSLNIPSTTSYTTTERCSTGLSNLKRQSLASVKNNLSSLPRRTSTTIYESDSPVSNMSMRTNLHQQQQQQTNIILEEREEFEDNNNEDDVANDLDEVQQAKQCNGKLTFKRQKLTNGAGVPLHKTKTTPLIAEGVNVRDSASESSDGGGGKAEASAGSSSGALPRKSAGLFNMSVGNSRNGSRTSSFGNGLNFYTHLEGRKSLFAGGTGPQAGISGGMPLNNSTLSLTSLNRRQFNASIYGSTSALSDSRLLNTFSPFYKGKTTYGGAAAYNKHTMTGTGTGAGASVVRITPTLIRPTSSLSTLSSSNNSTSAGGIHVPENPSAISSTAKRILDLINDFATPLSEAKKMASNLKPGHHHHQPPLNQSSSKRFNETDLNATRAMRLSQVRTPYTRPSVTLIPNAASNSVTSLPPVRELQVPSMSQLLQMKKMQHTTERSRQIATDQNSFKLGGGGGVVAAEYILPSDFDTPADSARNQKQHTNKIKNKVTRSVRTTGIKDSTMSSIDDEAPSAPLNLPNIAFPLMQSVPKFDINLLPSTKPIKSVAESEVSTAKVETKGISARDSQSKPQLETVKPNFAKSVVTTFDSATTPTSTPSKTTTINQFKFSTPLQLEGGATARTQNIVPINGNYKFSAPMIVERNSYTQQHQQQQQPQLKTGSVLDALKKPFTLPTAAVHAPAANDSLFAQFKKSTNEWECDTCMIRNKQDVPKCVACETPRKLCSAVSSSASKAAEPISTTTVFGNFGTQFKKSSNEWECDTCMIRNKQELSRCIACETPRKQASDNKESIKQSFGDAFKPKANTWECSTCLINNKSEANECVACQAKKPGSVQLSGTALKQVAPIMPTTDDGFKTLVAAQKASKWECEACMTRNDASKLKCVCCEQAKPGSDVVSDNVPKFNFGSTAAAKFSFGFGNQVAPKEEELRKNNEKSIANESSQAAVKSGTGFTFDLTSSSKLSTPSLASSGGFTFGIKPTVSVPTISKVTDVQDTVDNAKTMTSAAALAPALSGFKFGAVDSLSSNTTTNTTTSTANSVSTSTTKAGFVFGASTATAATKPMENVDNTAVSTVKFSLPATSAPSPFDNLKTSNQTVSTSPFGNSTSQEPTLSTFKPVQQSVPAAGFSFGLSKPANEASKSTTAAEEPKSSSFAFKSPTTATTAVLSTANSTFTFGTTPATVASATTTAANVKPMFSFGAPTSTSSAAPTAATSSLIKPTAAGFSFGSIAASNTSAPAPTKSSLFGVLPATTTTLSTQSTTATAAAPTTNMFSSFGAASTTGNSVFGSATPPNVSSSSSTFGTLAANSASSPFGAFSSTNNTAKPKTNSTISITMFGSNATSSSSATAFGFGSSPNVSTASTCNATSTTTATSSTTWPKNNFVFGSSSTAAPAGSTAPALSSNEAAKPTAFGTSSFGTSLTQAANNAPSSIFGSNPQASASSNFATAATFGSVVASTPVFGASSATVSTGVASNNNLFGGSSGVTNVTASSSTPTFGSSPFGGNNSAVVPATFGSAASSAATARVAPASTFGGFGASAAASNSTDGASAAKKSEPAFNFGATSAAPQSSSGGFNFGSGAAVTKPAFNFGASTGAAASFNFTGATAEIPKSTQPFQFGATPTPLAPVFNFSGGAVEATPNTTPFQFNAGSAQPAASNIFAPTPTPTGAQTAQQARRKIRAPMRRLTPR